MAEVEIHTGHEHANDEFGRRVGVMVGVIGIILAVVTISSHRAHTAAVIARTEANDQWSFFQSKKLRQHLDGGTDESFLTGTAGRPIDGRASPSMATAPTWVRVSVRRHQRVSTAASIP